MNGLASRARQRTLAFAAAPAILTAYFAFSGTVAAPPSVQTVPARTAILTKARLQDKIRGGWAGQTIGVHLRRPDRVPLQRDLPARRHPDPLGRRSIARAYKNSPGLYDDVYMDLTFVKVLEKEGLAAKAEAFANAFATAPYPLWHANQMARSNILAGLMPPGVGPLAE